MSRLLRILTIAILAYWASAFVIEPDFPIADGNSRNLYEGCPSTASEILIEITDCKVCGSCVLEKNKTLIIDIKFTPISDIKGLRFHYKVYPGMFDIVPLAEADKDAPNVTLPAGQEVIYSDDFSFSDEIPSADYKLSLDIFNMADLDSGAVACIVKCLIRVVDPSPTREALSSYIH